MGWAVVLVSGSPGEGDGRGFRACFFISWAVVLVSRSPGEGDGRDFRACFFMGWAVVLFQGRLVKKMGGAMNLVSSHKTKVIVTMEHQDKIRPVYSPTILTRPQSCLANFDRLWCFCRKETVKPWTAAIYHCKSCVDRIITDKVSLQTGKSCVDMIITDKVSSQIAITRH